MTANRRDGRGQGASATYRVRGSQAHLHVAAAFYVDDGIIKAFQTTQAKAVRQILGPSNKPSHQQMQPAGDDDCGMNVPDKDTFVHATQCSR